MKITNIALHAVLAVIGTASRASAKGFFRGSVEEKEDVRRETMGDKVSETYLDPCANGLGNCDSKETCGALIAEKMGLFDLSSLPNAGTKTSVTSLAGIKENAGYMKACYEVAEAHNACSGCRGYELEETKRGHLALTGADSGAMVHIPGCLNMSIGDCQVYAREILANHPEWFPEGLQGNFEPDSREVTSLHENWYWSLGIPVDGSKYSLDGATESAMGQEVHGLAGDCMVYYPYLWCVEVDTGNTQGGSVCKQLAPFDCSDPDPSPAKTCLSVGECCARINGDPAANPPKDALYIWPDINGNRLQCYAWPTGTPENGGETHTRPTNLGSRGTGSPDTGALRLIMITNRSKIVHPAIITAMKGFMAEADKGFSFIPDKDNINKWEQDYENVDEYMKKKGKGLPVFNADTEKSMAQLPLAQANNYWWKQGAATNVDAGSGYETAKPAGGASPRN